MTPGFEWYLPTWYGDIRLRVVEPRRTRVEVTALTRGELEAVRALKARSLKRGLLRRAWASERDWASMPDDAFAVGHRGVHHVILQAPLLAVESVLTRHLRGRAQTVSVAITDRGNLHEIRVPEPESDIERDIDVLPFRREHLVSPDETPVAATTVRQPTVGCPAPDFVQAHARATQTLRRFLSPEQVRDFERHQRFVTVGADTGHRYVITSRHARSELSTYSRTVYDVEEQRPYCVHDWGVPASEEMLTMHALISLPGWERYVRGIREEDVDRAVLPRMSMGRLVVGPPPPHFYYDANGCLRPTKVNGGRPS